MEEPIIFINGIQVTPEQAMAVRVAVTAQHSQMSDPADPTPLGDDAHGKQMAQLYRARSWEVLQIMQQE